MNNIGWNGFGKQLLLGEHLFNQLSEQEQFAFVAHEFVHAKKCYVIPDWHYVRKIFCIAITIILLARIIPRPPDNAVTALIMLSACLLAYMSISHHNEYEADYVASKKVNPEIYVSALRKLEPNTRWNVEYVTHSSVNKRIAKLNITHA